MNRGLKAASDVVQVAANAIGLDDVARTAASIVRSAGQRIVDALPSKARDIVKKVYNMTPVAAHVNRVLLALDTISGAHDIQLDDLYKVYPRLQVLKQEIDSGGLSGSLKAEAKSALETQAREMLWETLSQSMAQYLSSNVQYYGVRFTKLLLLSNAKEANEGKPTKKPTPKEANSGR